MTSTKTWVKNLKSLVKVLKADDNYNASNIKTMTKDGKVVIGLDKDLNGLNSISVPGKMALMVKMVYPSPVKMVLTVSTVKFPSVKMVKTLYPSLVKTA